MVRVSPEDSALDGARITAIVLSVVCQACPCIFQRPLIELEQDEANGRRSRPPCSKFWAAVDTCGHEDHRVDESRLTYSTSARPN